MKFKVLNDRIPERLRLRLDIKNISIARAYGLEEHIKRFDGVREVWFNPSNKSLLLMFDESKKRAILKQIHELDILQVKELREDHFPAAREAKRILENEIKELLFKRFVISPIMPQPIYLFNLFRRAVSYVKKGFVALKEGNVNIDVLDATAIGLSLATGEFDTANSVMFLLKLSSILEEYTRHRVKIELSESLAINVDKAWVCKGDDRKLVSLDDIEIDDVILVQTGNMIPLDGTVVSGDALVDESSMTGEFVAQVKSVGSTVYAGTVISEGDLHISVQAKSGQSRIHKIVDLIDNEETLKSSLQTKSENMADRFVPFTFAASLAVLALTRSFTKAMGVLMVDYSCAIKLSTPISVLTSIRQASENGIMVKGGRYLETAGRADTVVFDKTGTLTSATPTVTGVYAFEPYTRDEVLKISACIEEHFPHSVAKAIVKKADEENILHREEHAVVEYVVAHGISTMLHGERVCIGSKHFIYDDEECSVTDAQQEYIDEKGALSSVIYLMIGRKLAGFITIDDPPRAEAKSAVDALYADGINDIVMLTGDNEAAARYVSNLLGIFDYRYQVLPEDKLRIVGDIKSEDRTVLMVGDGINDSPALAGADVSIAMHDASDIAREVADIVIMENDLEKIVWLRKLSRETDKRIKLNSARSIGLNSIFILLGLFGVITPTLGALLHNTGTMILASTSMRRYKL